jgi:two-component system, NarL family, nitrate/nitrite response regulator NarL
MQDSLRLRVLLADDHAMVRDGLRSLIEVDWPNAQFLMAENETSTLVALSQSPPPDLAVIDVRMPGMRGAASFAEFRQINSVTPIVVVTGLDDPGLKPSLHTLGATAVVSKEVPAATLLATLHAALQNANRESVATQREPISAPISDGEDNTSDARGSHQLSERQRETLRLLHEGLPNKLIAARLGLSEATVKGHLHALYTALNVRGRAEAVALTRDWLL